MIEDLLSQTGLVPDIDDDTLGAAYETCPAVQKSIIKNAVSFAYAVAQTGREAISTTERYSHVERTTSVERLDWAFFIVDERLFPLPAVFSAMVQALVAKVDTLLVDVRGPVSDPFLFGCDLLSVNQIFRDKTQPVLEVLSRAGRGVILDLAGLDLDLPGMIRPRPGEYGVSVHLPASEYVEAYRVVTAHYSVTGTRPYIAYGGAPGDALISMDSRYLGCWIWDVVTPDTFRSISYTFS